MVLSPTQHHSFFRNLPPALPSLYTNRSTREELNKAFSRLQIQRPKPLVSCRKRGIRSVQTHETTLVIINRGPGYDGKVKNSILRYFNSL